ncbi:MAG: endonuclease/exonuclease/phosphatase family protein [Bdellovibrionales bacterium]|jgi:endonuclease/exonuclease/phosphatase (EEP) superfamily protein YafD|nr:endonuclease/exonuclease/phosphatase family protein [Bdellovibrionales bacterium]
MLSQTFNKLLLVLLLLSPAIDSKAFWFSVPDATDVIVTMGAASKKLLDPTSIKLLVWNMYKGKNESWEDDFNYLKENRDILVLQESLMNDHMEGILNNDNDFSYLLATSFVYKKGKKRTGVVTGSSVLPVNSYHKKSRDLEWIGLTPKAMLFTEYLLSGYKETLLVVNIHAINSVPWFILARQLKQAGKKIKKHDGPVVFAGDFNTWTKKKIKYMRKYLTSVGLVEVNFPNGDKRMKSSFTKKILDYIWIKDLNYTNSYVWEDIEGADHKAMSVELSVKD